MKKCSTNNDILVLGEDLCADVFASVLNGVQVRRLPDDVGWAWPEKLAAKIFSLIVVPSREAPASQVVRWHAEARSCVQIQDAKVLIVCADGPQSCELAARDVFGRRGNTGDSFAAYRKYIAISIRMGGLTTVLSLLAQTNSLLRDAWNREKEKAFVLPALEEALRTRSATKLAHLKPRLDLVDWDAFCPHARAHRIKRWLASVPEGVAPLWEEGLNCFGL